MTPNISRCPDHPEAKAIRASIVASDRLVWVCLYCGRKLGDAGPRRKLEVETQYITPEVTDEVKT